MLNFIKKGAALALVAAMAVSASACNGNKETGKGAGNKNNTSANSVDLAEYTLDSEALLASMPAELKNTEITYLSWYDPEKMEEKEVFDAFTEKTGIKITNRVVGYGNYVDTLAGLLSVGETPDVVRMMNPSVGIMKLLQPLSVTGFDFTGKEWDKSIMDRYTCGDNVYAAALVNTPFLLPNLLFYNKDTMEEMGFDNPWELWKQGKWTWDVFKDMLTEWVNQGTEYTGACLWPCNAAGVANGNSCFVKSIGGGKYELDLNNTKALESWKLTEDCVVQNLLTNLNDGFDQAKQKLLFASMTASPVQGKTNDYFTKTRLRGQLECVPAPLWNEEAEYYLPIGEATAFGIPKAAKNAKAVPYFIGYVANFDNYDQSVYNKDSNPTGFFYSEQTKECFLTCLSIKNKGFTPDSDVFTYTMDTPFTWLLFFKVDSSQLNTYLQTNQYIYQNSLDLYNADIDILSKPQ